MAAEFEALDFEARVKYVQKLLTKNPTRIPIVISVGQKTSLKKLVKER